MSVYGTLTNRCLIDNTSEGGRYCFDQTPKPRLVNAVGATIGSWAVNTAKFSQYLPRVRG